MQNQAELHEHIVECDFGLLRFERQKQGVPFQTVIHGGIPKSIKTESPLNDPSKYDNTFMALMSSFYPISELNLEYNIDLRNITPTGIVCNLPPGNPVSGQKSRYKFVLLTAGRFGCSPVKTLLDKNGKIPGEGSTKDPVILQLDYFLDNEGESTRSCALSGSISSGSQYSVWIRVSKSVIQCWNTAISNHLNAGGDIDEVAIGSDDRFECKQNRIKEHEEFFLKIGANLINCP